MIYIYMYNITNLANVRAGAKPHLDEVGPYVYRKWRVKEVRCRPPRPLQQVNPRADARPLLSQLLVRPCWKTLQAIAAGSDLPLLGPHLSRDMDRACQNPQHGLHALPPARKSPQSAGKRAGREV
jgi:CD36 family